MDIKNSKVIVAPLNWGLGHATRCIPIIDKLIDQGNDVFLASDGNALSLLKLHYPHLPAFDIPGYNIRYRFNSIFMDIMWQSPHIIKTFFQEQKAANYIVKKTGAFHIISDNRFGFRASKTHNIYITHQLNIPPHNSAFSGLANFFHHKIIHRFQECWVPDYEGGNSLSGKLSQGKLRIPVNYIGTLSRLERESITQDIDILVILSGPEPKRTILERKLKDLLSPLAHDYTIHVVRGTQEKQDYPSDRLKVSGLMTGPELNQLMNRSRIIISRCGYTTVMDVEKLNREAILIPTPGQYEQEYLARYLENRKGFHPLSEQSLAETIHKKINTILNENKV